MKLQRYSEWASINQANLELMIVGPVPGDWTPEAVITISNITVARMRVFKAWIIDNSIKAQFDIFNRISFFENMTEAIQFKLAFV